MLLYLSTCDKQVVNPNLLLWICLGLGHTWPVRCHISNNQISCSSYTNVLCSVVLKTISVLIPVHTAWVNASCKNVFYDIKMHCHTGNRVYWKQGAIWWHCPQDRKYCALVIGQRKYFARPDGWRFIRACQATRFTLGSRPVSDVFVIFRIIMLHHLWTLSKHRLTKRTRDGGMNAAAEFVNTHSHTYLHLLFIITLAVIRRGGFLYAAITS